MFQEFTRLPDLSEYGLIFWGGPIAFIIKDKNHIKVRKIYRMRDFFINEFGIFEVDTEAQYRFNKQAVSFYNSHGTLIPKKIAKRVNKYYQQGKFFEIRKELIKIYPQLSKLKFKTIYEMFRFIVKDTQHKSIDIDTEKFMPYFRAYNPISIKRLNEACQAGRKAVDDLNPSLKPPMPLVVAAVIGIVAIAFIQNGPKYVREAVAYFEDFGEAASGNVILGLQTLLGG